MSASKKPRTNYLTRWPSAQSLTVAARAMARSRALKKAALSAEISTPALQMIPPAQSAVRRLQANVDALLVRAAQATSSSDGARIGATDDDDDDNDDDHPPAPIALLQPEETTPSSAFALLAHLAAVSKPLINPPPIEPVPTNARALVVAIPPDLTSATHNPLRNQKRLNHHRR